MPIMKQFIQSKENQLTDESKIKQTNTTRAEEFGQNYVRSAATTVDKSENSPQFSYIILR